MRTESRRHQREQGPENWADVDDAAAVRWLEAAGTRRMVHGHTHRPASHELTGGAQRHVLSDWDFDHPGAERADVLRWQADGMTRHAPATAS